jgi:hypothetical protein
MEKWRWKYLFWPPATDPNYRKIMIRMGSFMSFFYAVMWGLGLIGVIASAILAQDSVSGGTLFNALIHFMAAGLIGWGIVKKIKVAPVAGLILSLIGLIENFVSNGFMNIDTVLGLLLIWMFIQSTCGIFEHHRIKAG